MPILTVGTGRALLGGRGIPATDVSGLLSYWDPLDLSTLFQEIAGTTPVAADGQNVGLMTGAVNAVAFADDATRPIYAAAGINGRGALNLAAASVQRLHADAIAAALSGDDIPFSWVVVAQPTTTLATTYIMAMGNTGSADPLVGLRTTGGNNVQHARRASVAEGAKVITSPGTIADGDPHVFGVRFDGTQGDIWIDGVQVNAYTDLNVSSMVLNAFALGVFPSTSMFFPWNGLIGRVAVYSRTLTAAEISGVSRNFGDAYGIATM